MEECFELSMQTQNQQNDLRFPTSPLFPKEEVIWSFLIRKVAGNMVRRFLSPYRFNDLAPNHVFDSFHRFDFLQKIEKLGVIPNERLNSKVDCVLPYGSCGEYNFIAL
jgi:hypothetical protein